ncbi:hypothetical protein GCM10022402_34060 [Salinactinospora qingdaonensis]|uniref:Uncharacterized protein n=1 Tax=Salinactinospora qingdaonensis TaxID=702744 RepID=A0ABP7G2J3_9ACTN
MSAVRIEVSVRQAQRSQPNGDSAGGEPAAVAVSVDAGSVDGVDWLCLIGVTC